DIPKDAHDQTFAAELCTGCIDLDRKLTSIFASMYSFKVNVSAARRPQLLVELGNARRMPNIAHVHSDKFLVRITVGIDRSLIYLEDRTVVLKQPNDIARVFG